LSAAWTNHQDTPCARATSPAARPEAMTAATSWSLSRAVERANLGTCTLASANVPTVHAASAQNQRRLAHHSSTAPATGTSRRRCRRRECTREAITPHLVQPGGSVDSTVIRRPPSGRSTASITRNPGRLKIVLAASRREPVGSFTLVAGWLGGSLRQDPSQQDHEPSRHHDAPDPITTNLEEPVRDASRQYLRMSWSLPQVRASGCGGFVASRVFSGSGGRGDRGAFAFVVASALGLGECLEAAGQVQDLALQRAQA